MTDEELDSPSVDESKSWSDILGVNASVVNVPSWASLPYSADTPQQIWQLEISELGAQSVRLPIERNCTIIGQCSDDSSSSPQSEGYINVNVSEGSVAKYHTALLLNAGASDKKKLVFHLLDLGADAGTLVNGVRVASGESICLSVGDKFIVGDSTQVYRLVRGSAEARGSSRGAFNNLEDTALSLLVAEHGIDATVVHEESTENTQEEIGQLGDNGTQLTAHKGGDAKEESARSGNNGYARGRRSTSPERKDRPIRNPIHTAPRSSSRDRPGLGERNYGRGRSRSRSRGRPVLRSYSRDRGLPRRSRSRDRVQRRSRSRGKVYSKRSRSHDYAPSVRSRSRDRQPMRRERSRSRGPPQRRSRSREYVSSKRSRSRDYTYSKRSRSRDYTYSKRSRSREKVYKKRSRSRSPIQQRRSRSRGKAAWRSHSRGRDDDRGVISSSVKGRPRERSRSRDVGRSAGRSRDARRPSDRDGSWDRSPMRGRRSPPPPSKVSARAAQLPVARGPAYPTPIAVAAETAGLSGEKRSTSVDGSVGDKGRKDEVYWRKYAAEYNKKCENNGERLRREREERERLVAAAALASDSAPPALAVEAASALAVEDAPVVAVEDAPVVAVEDASTLNVDVPAVADVDTVSQGADLGDSGEGVVEESNGIQGASESEAHMEQQQDEP